MKISKIIAKNLQIQEGPRVEEDRIEFHEQAENHHSQVELSQLQNISSNLLFYCIDQMK